MASADSDMGISGKSAELSDRSYARPNRADTLGGPGTNGAYAGSRFAWRTMNSVQDFRSSDFSPRHVKCVPEMFV